MACRLATECCQVTSVAVHLVLVCDTTAHVQHVEEGPPSLWSEPSCMLQLVAFVPSSHSLVFLYLAW
jgi:hypothetical protein